MTLVINADQLRVLERDGAVASCDALRQSAAERWPTLMVERFDVGVRFRTADGRVSTLRWVDGVWEVETPTGITQRFTTTLRGGVATIDFVGGTRAQLAYDERGRLSSIALDGEPHYHFSWEGDELIEQTFPDGATWRYDDHGARVSLDGVLIYSSRRDAQGRVSRYTDAAGGTYELRHDAKGQLTDFIDARGRAYALRWTDDARLRELSVDGAPVAALDHGDGQVTARFVDQSWQRFAYDARGRLVSAENASAHLKRALNERGAVQREESEHVVAQLDYNDRGELSSLSWRAEGPDAVPELAASMAFAHDAEGRIEEVTIEGQRFAFGYGGQPKLATIAYPSGVRQQMRYDRRLRLVETRLEGTEALVEQRYQYDRGDRIVASSSEYLHQTFGYDGLGRLINSGCRQLIDHPSLAELRGEGAIERDANGNQLGYGMCRAAYSAGNQLEQLGEEMLRYDLWDNLIERVSPTAQWSYQWSERHHLHAIRSNGADVLRCSYDAAGRRITKRSSEGMTHFYWVGTQLVGEVRQEGRTRRTRRYYWLPSAFAPFAMWQDGAWYAVHTNRLHQPICLTDEAGRVVWRAEYDAYGRANVLEEAFEFELRGVGQYWDGESGLHYNFARYYDPVIGRYISPDPLGSAAGSLNAYLYCDGDPLNRIEPLGLFPIAAGEFVGAVAVSGASYVVNSAMRNSWPPDPVTTTASALSGGVELSVGGGLRSMISEAAGGGMTGALSSIAASPVTNLVGDAVGSAVFAAASGRAGEVASWVRGSLAGGLNVNLSNLGGQMLREAMVTGIGDALGGGVLGRAAGGLAVSLGGLAFDYATSGTLFPGAKLPVPGLVQGC